MYTRNRRLVTGKDEQNRITALQERQGSEDRTL